jgi:hypothetical protein
LVQPRHSAALVAQGLQRIQFASAAASLVVPDMKAPQHDIFGAFSLPKGMHEFAVRNQIIPLDR